MLKQLLLLFYVFYSIACLYEDQAGKFDWYQQYIGKVDKLYIEKQNSPDRRLIVTSENNNVHAAINLFNGAIEWRQHLNEDEKLLSSDYCKNHLVTITAINQGALLRAWDTSVGIILWEVQLSENILHVAAVKCNIKIDAVFIYSDDSVSSYNLKNGNLNWNSKLNSKKSIFASNFYYTKSLDHVILVSKTDKQILFHLFENSGKLLNFPENKQISVNSKCYYHGNSEVYYCMDWEKSKLFFINVKQMPMTWKSFILDSQALISSGKSIENIEIKSPDLLIVTVKNSNVLTNPYSVFVFNIPPENANVNNINILFKIDNIRLQSCLELDGSNYIATLAYFTDKKSMNNVVKFYDLSDGREISYLTNHYHLAKHYGGPEKFEVLLFKKKDNNLAYRLLIISQDNALHFINQNGNVFWTREESLANVASVEMLDLPVSDTEAKMDEEFGHNNDNVFTKFIKRISTQLKQLKYFLQEQLKRSKTAKDLKEDVSCDKNEFQCQSESSMSDMYSAVDNNDESTNSSSSEYTNIVASLRRDSFNVHKMLVLATTSGKIFGMHSSTGQIIWRYLIDDATTFTNGRIQLFILRTTAHFPHPPEAVLLMKSKTTHKPLLHVFNPITGLSREGSSKQLNYNIYLATMLSLPVSEENSYSKPVLLLDRDLMVHIYPASFQLSLETHPIYLYRVDYQSGAIFGYEVKQHPTTDCRHSQNQQSTSTKEHPNCYLAHEVWTANFAGNQQKISAVSFKSPIEQVHSVGRILSDRNVLYKYLNPNLLAVATESINQESQNAAVTIYLLDVVTGKIIYSTIHRRAGGLVNLIQSENWIVYSFQNLKSHRTEIAVLELYEPYEIPEATLQEIKDVDIAQLRRSMKSNRNNVGSGFDILSIMGGERATTKQFSSKQRSRIDPNDGDLITGPVVLKQSYIIGTFIRKAAVSITEKGITSKSVLLALETGGILELPKALLDPRRSLMMSQELLEEGVEPYMPEIPIRSFSIINYNRTVASLRGIYAGPSGLESTSLVFIHGLDLFFTQIAPSKMYDVLKEDFDYVFIGTVTIGMIIGAFVTQKLAATRALYRAWQ